MKITLPAARVAADRLRAAETPIRRLDIDIALATGWTRVSTYQKAAENERTKTVSWFKPDDSEPSAVPNFTTSIDAAIELANSILPADYTAAFQWGENFGVAIVNSGPAVDAPTMELALCIAVLEEAISLSEQISGDLS